MKVTRRKFLKTLGAGAVVGGASAFGAGRHAEAAPQGPGCFKKNAPDHQNSLFDKLPTCCIRQPLDKGEMRITFLGTSCTPMLTQQGVSVYVEVGPTDANGVPLDYVMFDCGMGCLANYIAAGIPYGLMDKIFIAHPHADHMGELSAIYCFGEGGDRKSPLYVWGPSKSELVDPVSGEIHEDGIRTTLEHFREVWRWHTESFSFAGNGYPGYKPPTKENWGLPCDPVPVGKYASYQDPLNDAYALVPIELNWRNTGEEPGDNVAYSNQLTGVKITHFPVIHCRQGSIGYKLEWTSPDTGETLSMVYSSDTRPTKTMIAQASGIDVLVHEIVMPPDKWTMKFADTDNPDVNPAALVYLRDVQNSSHTTQGAFGYILTEIDPRPRLTVATHFQATDDTIACAVASLDAYGIRHDGYTFASDFMQVNVKKTEIRVRRLEVSAHEFPYMGRPVPQTLDDPKYHKHTVDKDGNPIVVGDPEAQLLLTDAIRP